MMDIPAAVPTAGVTTQGLSAIRSVTSQLCTTAPRDCHGSVQLRLPTNRSFTSLQMVHAHTHTRSRRTGLDIVPMKDEDENEGDGQPTQERTHREGARANRRKEQPSNNKGREPTAASSNNREQRLKGKHKMCSKQRALLVT